MSFMEEIIKGVIVAVVGGVPTFVIGFYLSLKYIMPKMTADTAVATADALVKHQKIQPWIKDAKELVEKAKQVDFQELVEMAKGLKVFIELQNQSQPPPPPQKKE